MPPAVCWATAVRDADMLSIATMMVCFLFIGVCCSRLKLDVPAPQPVGNQAVASCDDRVGIGTGPLGGRMLPPRPFPQAPQAQPVRSEVPPEPVLVKACRKAESLHEFSVARARAGSDWVPWPFGVNSQLTRQNRFVVWFLVWRPPRSRLRCRTNRSDLGLALDIAAKRTVIADQSGKFPPSRM